MKWICAQTKTHIHPSPMAYSIGVIYADTMKTVVGGVCFEDTVAFFKDGVMYWYALAKGLEKASNKAFEIVKKDPTYLHKLRDRFVNIVPELINFSYNQVYKNNLTNLSGKELWRLYEKYLKLYDEIYTCGEPITLGLNDSLGGYLKDYLNNKVKTKKELTKYYNILVSPREMSFIKREEIDSLNIAVDISKDKLLMKLFSKNIHVIKKEIIKFEINKKITNHVEAYKWVPYDYGVSVWTKDYFLKTLKILLKSGNINDKLSKSSDYFNKLPEQQDEIIEKLKIDDKNQALFQALRDCAFLMDYKKEEFTRSHLYIQPLITEIGKRLGLTKIETRYLLPEEIKNYLLIGKKPNQKNINARTKKCLVYWKGRNVKIYEPGDAQKMFDALMEHGKSGNSLEDDTNMTENMKIDGIIASPGKAFGKVKIVLSSKDINKVKEGDILVAVMTSPDYVVGMKKAAAIITNEGGITCHAAIVSRELGIPCIVGTKIATKYLKDNEEIEVNANHGSVRIVKRD